VSVCLSLSPSLRSQTSAIRGLERSSAEATGAVKDWIEYSRDGREMASYARHVDGTRGEVGEVSHCRCSVMGCDGHTVLYCVGRMGCGTYMHMYYGIVRSDSSRCSRLRLSWLF
jgi:hypothetical protein